MSSLIHKPKPSIKLDLFNRRTYDLDQAQAVVFCQRRLKRTIRKLRKLGPPLHSWVWGAGQQTVELSLTYHRQVASMYDIADTIEFLEAVLGECTDAKDTDEGNRQFSFEFCKPGAKLSLTFYAIPAEEKDSKNGRRCRKVLLKTIEERDIRTDTRNIYAIVCD